VELPISQVAPDLFNTELRDATAIVSDLGLRLELAEPDQYPEIVAFVVRQEPIAGHVFRQEPIAGQVISDDRVIRVWLHNPAGRRLTPIVTTFSGDDPSSGVREPLRPSPNHGDDPIELEEPVQRSS
jgi:hypothetical protein